MKAQLDALRTTMQGCPDCQKQKRTGGCARHLTKRAALIQRMPMGPVKLGDGCHIEMSQGKAYGVGGKPFAVRRG
jgi:hypothetical protein